MAASRILELRAGAGATRLPPAARSAWPRNGPSLARRIADRFALEVQRTFQPEQYLESADLADASKRHGLSVISTVTNKGQMRWKIFDGALNADILIDFLKRLVRGSPRKLFVILDNLRVHHSKPVKAWLAEHRDEIEVFYLPSYSPELNPDEMANADLKQAVTKLAPARTKLQLVKATARHLKSVQRQLERIRNYFEHQPIRYAA